MSSIEKALAAVQSRIPQADVDAAEIFFHHQRHLAIQSKDEQVDSLERSDALGLALRLEQAGKLGFAYTTDLSDRALSKLVRTAVDSLQTVEPKVPQLLPIDAAQPSLKTVQQFDAGLEQRPVADKIDKVIELESCARAYDPHVSHVRMTTYEEQADEILLWNSRFGERRIERTLCQLHLMVMAGDESGRESAWNIGFSPFFEQLDPVPIGEEAARDAVRMLGAGKVPTGRYPAILDRGVVAQCLGILAPSFLAESVQKKKSRLAGKQGQSLYSDPVTIYDDGLYPDGVMTAPYDAEGIPSQTTVLVAKGVIDAFLYDTISAHVEGQVSTGNSIRESFKEMPRAGTRNFYLEPGSQKPAALVSDIRSGVQIQDVIGIHTANPITGDFSVGAAGFRIEKGSLVEPIRGFAISGNLHDILASVEGVGDDLKFYGSVGAPTVRISGLDVGGT